jgi:hypothetical protein
MAPSFFDNRARSDGGSNASRAISADQRTAYPTLAKLLSGVPAAKGQAALPRFGLSLYAGDGGISWTLKEVGGPENWYGGLLTHADPLAELDMLLATGECKRGRDKLPNRET